MKRAFSLVAIVCSVMLFATGCSSTGKAPSTGVPSAAKDTAGAALAIAYDQMKPVAPDAVPILITTPRISFAPPPSEWTVMFVSPEKKLLYNVPVVGKKAEKPRSVGSAAVLKQADIDAAVGYDTLKIGSEEAARLATEELSKSGGVPKNLMQSITLVKHADLTDDAIATWHLSFFIEGSPTALRTATVDAMTGAVTETTKK